MTENQETGNKKLSAPLGDQPEAQGELFTSQKLVREVLKVEQERIDSINKRTEVARLAIEASNESDKRQFEFHMTRLANENADKVRKHALARNLLYGTGIMAAVILIFLFWLSFFGNETQRDLAIRTLVTLGIGGGGYGIVSTFVAAMKKLLNVNLK